MQIKFKKIKSIKYKEESDYYDLEVPKYHNYINHGFINHNSAIAREGAIKSSDEFFRTFSTSVKTRYGNKGFGIMFSWPRASINDFILDKYYEAERSAGMGRRYAYGFRFMTHELLPENYHAFSGKKIDYRVLIDRDSLDYQYLGRHHPINEDGMIVVQVPEELSPGMDEEVENWEDFEAKILCIPPAQSGALFRYPQAIDGCVIPKDLWERNYKIYELKDIYDTIGGYSYKIKKIASVREMGYPQRQIPRIVFIDKSKKSDLTCAVMGYGEPTTFTGTDIEGKEYKVNGLMAVVEEVIVWEPEKNKKIMLYPPNIDEIVLHACSFLNVKKVSGDEWDPASPERFRQAGVEWERKIIQMSDWENLTAAFYAGRIRIPEYRPLIIDLKTLVREGNNRVSHSDIAYCVCGFYSYFHDSSLLEVLGINRPRPSLAYTGIGLGSGEGASRGYGIIPKGDRMTTLPAKKRPLPKLIRR